MIEFIYFFGLWCGDRAGGKRFGICNQNEAIIKFTKKFLKKNYQKIEKFLYIQKDLAAPKVDYDKVNKIQLEEEIENLKSMYRNQMTI